MHVSGVDRRSLSLDVRHPPGELIARDNPQPEGEPESEKDGRLDGESVQRFAMHHSRILSRAGL